MNGHNLLFENQNAANLKVKCHKKMASKAPPAK